MNSIKNIDNNSNKPKLNIKMNEQKRNQSEIENEIKNTLHQLSGDISNFDNNNIEKSIKILNNIEQLSKSISSSINNKSNSQNVEIKQKNNQERSIVTNETKKSLLNYILSTNEALIIQLKSLETYIEVQKIFTSFFFQNIEIFLKKLKLSQDSSNQIKDDKISNNNKNLLSINPLLNIIPQNLKNTPTIFGNNLLSTNFPMAHFPTSNLVNQVGSFGMNIFFEPNLFKSLPLINQIKNNNNRNDIQFFQKIGENCSNQK